MARIVRAWRALPPERRLAATAAIALFFTLFLNWYQETVIAGSQKVGAARTGVALTSASVSLTGWEAFSFVEAAVLLVAVGVLVLLFMRAEGRAFHVPGGDGGVITAAGFWTCVLIVWRIFDKEGTTGHNQFATTSGIDWGIFVALAVAGLLTYAGSRIRRAADPEPPLPGDPDPVAAFDGPPAGARPDRARPRSRSRDQIRPERRRPPSDEIPPDADETWEIHGTASRDRPVSAAARGRDDAGPPASEPPLPQRRRSALSRREIQEIDIAEPPPPTLRRARPAPYRAVGDLRADDQRPSAGRGVTGRGGAGHGDDGRASADPDLDAGTDDSPTLPDHPGPRRRD